VNPLSFTFPNGVSIKLFLEDGLYKGIEEARLTDDVFLVAGRGSGPYCVTPEGIAYSEFRVQRCVMENETITVECDAIGRAMPLQQNLDVFNFPLLSSLTQTVVDKMRVRIMPRSVVVGAERYEGFEVAYEWHSDSRKIHWLYDSVAFAPQGTARGSRVMAQNMTTHACPLEAVLDLDTFWSTAETYDRICIQSPGRGAGSQFFNLVAGPRLTAVTYFEPAAGREKALKANCQKAKGEDFVTVSDLHYGNLASDFFSAPRVVLATTYAATSREEDINRWSAWFDFTAEAWCTELGIPRARAMPLLTFEGTGNGAIDPGTTYPELLKVWAERIDWVVAQGFQAINLHTPEWIGAANQETVVFGGNNCSPWEFKLSDFLGGEEGLRIFCDVCHSRGIKVFVWIAGHLQREAPVWKQHPEWMVKQPNGAVWDGQYGGIHSLSFVHGARVWILADLKTVRAATGIDGVWLDSFANLTYSPINWQSPGLEPNGPAVLRFLSELSAAGFEIMIEGISQLGISSWGNLPPAVIAGHEELMTNSSMRYNIPDSWAGNPPIARDSYFRMLAARAPMGVWLNEFLGRPEPFPPALPDWYAPLTRAFNEVEPRMQTRKLLKDGALWFAATGQPSAYFAFADSAKIEGVPNVVTAIDLLAEKPEKATRFREGQIYQLQS
jgi:hypothetical protein